MRRARRYKSLKEFARAQKRIAISERRDAIQDSPENESTLTLQAELRRIERDLQDFYNDPMTEQYGANDCDGPIRRQGRGVFLELCSRGVEQYDGDCVTASRY